LSLLIPLAGLLLVVLVAGMVYSVRRSRERARQELERRLLRLAQDEDGRLITARAALALHRPVEEVEERLRSLAHRGLVEMTHDDRGSPIFEVPQLLAEPLSADPHPDRPHRPRRGAIHRAPHEESQEPYPSEVETP